MIFASMSMDQSPKMESDDKNDDFSHITEAKIQQLKDKYSRTQRNEPDNPINVCMKLIFQAAIEKDPARRTQLSLELSEFLTKPGGVINLFLAIVDFDTSSQKVTTHNQRFISVAQIITCLPSLCMQYEEYCSNISRQLKTLLISDKTQYSALASIIIKAMIDSPHSKGKEIEKVILDPIFRALKLPDQSYKPHEAIVAIHNLTVNHLPTSLIVSLFPRLFYAAVVLNDTPSRLKSLLKSCMVTILNHLKPGAACCLIDETLFHSNHIARSYIKSAEEEEISIKLVCDADKFDTEFEVACESVVVIVISLLESSNNELLVMEFFFHFQETMYTSKEERVKMLSNSLLEPILLQTIQEGPTKLDLIGTITTNSSRSLELILRSLLVSLTSLRCDEGDLNTNLSIVSPTLKSNLNILEVLCLTTQQEADKVMVRQQILPILFQLQELITKKDDGCMQMSLCEILNQLVVKIKTGMGDRDGLDETDNLHGRMDDELDCILQDLNDKLVPVRVHALVRLKQMVMTNDKYIVSKIPTLYPKIEASLADQEPYVFLASINLMSEMALRKTSEILPKLVDLYTRKNLDIQARINVGEVLVRLVKQMNQTTPFYAQQVMGILFKGARDDEELIRISSLTNMGEMCHNLGDSLGKYIVEILHCIECIIGSDSIQVKCAAVDLLRTALSGLDRLKVESIQRELGSIYGLLKRLRSRCLDDKLCLQADLALDEVDRLARDMLGMAFDDTSSKGDSLVKNIKVLSLDG